MIFLWFPQQAWLWTAVGLLFSVFATMAAMKWLSPFLPRDGGREFAHDGKLSAGKPRGAGILFIMVFALSGVAFIPMSMENGAYILLVIASMLTGYLDDAAKKPWGEFKKGILDLCVAALSAIVFLRYNSGVVEIALLNTKLVLPPVVFAVLAAALIWGSVNVTNCADGVDGLSATLTIITLGFLSLAGDFLGKQGTFPGLTLMMIGVLLGYLWFNATPSLLMMGDAGSRAMGLFIALAALKTGAPLLYIPMALVLILDGGLGLLKVSLIRVCKVHIMKNIRTPLHDHVRKVWSWSNAQTVYRFAMIQLLVCAAVYYGLRFVNGR